MKIDLNAGELWDLLKQGTTNQRNFINSLRFSEFEEFIDILEGEYPEMDLIGNINGGVLWVEDDPVEDYVIWKNDRITICWI